MGTKAQHQVQFRGADFQQQVGVAGEAGDQALVGLAEVEHHRFPSPFRERGQGRG
ncbi:hypothetical protein D3C85_1931120 [compost metagenome]